MEITSMKPQIVPGRSPGRAILVTQVAPPQDTGVLETSGNRYAIPICPDIIRRIEAWRRGTQVHPSVRDYLDHLELQEKWRDKLLADSSILDPRMWKDQNTGSMWLYQSHRAILGDEQGKGKTVTAINAAERKPGIRKAVIICSNRKKQDWYEHVLEWSSGISTARKLEESHIDKWPPDKYLIVNYTQAEMNKDFLSGCDLVIADEAHILRNRKTKVFQAVKQICGKLKAVFLLTATPNLNETYDVWALLNICDPVRFSSFWSFVYRFCNVTSNGFGMEIEGIRDGEQKALAILLKEYVLTRYKEPSKITRRKISYHMKGTQADLYIQLENDHIAEWEGQVVEAQMTLPWITRLRQIAIHPGLVFKGYEGPSKLDVLADLLQERETQSIIFVRQSKLARLTEEYLNLHGISSIALYGSMTPTRQTKNLSEFHEGNHQVLVCTHGTGGEGLNLVNAERVIWLELAWHPGGNKHAQDRIDRPGQRSDNIEAVVIHTEDSVEDHIWDIVHDKQRVTTGRIAEAML